MNIPRLEILGSAAAGIAHDLNNQLNLIINHLAVADIEGAHRVVERCAALTGNLLTFCKDDAFEVSAIDPAEFLLDFVDQIEVSEGIEVRLDLAASLPAISANALALTRALTNLISNACDAVHGKGVIRIIASPRAIDVADSGEGVSEEIRPRIFDPFFTSKEAGTGLGLTIVRDLMYRQGGSVSVHSEPGQGAHFILHFRAG